MAARCPPRRTGRSLLASATGWQLELVDLVWNALESDILTIGTVFQFERDSLPEVMGFVPRAACGELTARACLRILGEKHACIPCSGYER